MAKSKIKFVGGIKPTFECRCGGMASGGICICHGTKCDCKSEPSITIRELRKICKENEFDLPIASARVCVSQDIIRAAVKASKEMK